MVFQRSIATQIRVVCCKRTPSVIHQSNNQWGRLPSTRGGLQCMAGRSATLIPNNRVSARSAPTFVTTNSLGALLPTSTKESYAQKQQIRMFQNVGHYHNVADDTLNAIQDAIEDYFEDNCDPGVAEKEDDIPEVNYASGVLTIYLPPYGTWVINKQTPNEQIWWSSPISGPRRYEYDEKREKWVYSRMVDESESEDGNVKEDTLGGILNAEFEELLGEGLDLEA